MSNFGLLLTLTEPRPELEAEFNAWYDTEHIAERLRIPGFLSARRWVADLEPGEGKYLATYELVSPGVLQSEAYRERFAHPTPWTQRNLGRTVVFRRWACEQINPGDALPPLLSHALFVAIGDVAPPHQAEFNRWFDEEHLPLLAQVPGVLRARRFFDPVGKPRYIALYDLADESVPSHPGWKASMQTEWSGKILGFMKGHEWILRLYRSYVPAATA
jgi:hypothetical protein